MIMPIPTPVSGGLILSYRCSAACKHCMYACTPEWSRDRISTDDLELILAQLSETIQPSPEGPEAMSLSHGLHFTGGEPFLDFDLLCKAVEIAEGLGIPSTFVETNCAWCVDDRTAREKLRVLKDKGLDGIMISVNPFFLEFVPFERTRRAIRHALEVFGRNVIVYQLEYYRRFEQRGIRGKVPLEDYLKLEPEEDFSTNLEFFLMGRAPYALEPILDGLFPRHTVESLAAQPCWPPFLRGWHNHFDNYGNYMPGFCGGISLGDCRQLRTLLDEGVELDDRPVLGFLVKDDLRGLLGFARERGYGEAERGYFSKCHLCTDIRKHLAAVGNFEELAPREFYTHLAGS